MNWVRAGHQSDASAKRAGSSVKATIGVDNLAIAAMMASIFLTACGTNPKENHTSFSENVPSDARPQLKREYPCQNLHVKPPNCPQR